MKEKTTVADIDRSRYDFRFEEDESNYLASGLTPEIISEISQEKGDPCWPNRYPRDEMRDEEDDSGNRPERVEDQIQEEAQYEPAIDARPFHCAVPISSQRTPAERARFPLPVLLWYSLPGRKQVPFTRFGGWHISKGRGFWRFGHFANLKGAISNTMLYGRCRAGEPFTRRNGG